MPNIKSAIKRARQSDKRRLKNQSEKSAIRTAEKKLRALVTEKKTDEAVKMQAQLSSMVDKASKRNLIHENAAARKKSRISKLIKKTQAVA